MRRACYVIDELNLSRLPEDDRSAAPGEKDAGFLEAKVDELVQPVIDNEPLSHQKMNVLLPAQPPRPFSEASRTANR